MNPEIASKLFSKDYYSGLEGFYFKLVLKELIKIGKLNQENGTILDFGCGFGYLKKSLPNHKVVGYDIIEKFTEIKDYKKLKPSVIVCNAVLQYFDKEGLSCLLDEFKKMNPSVKIVVGTPTENILSKIGKRILGYKEAHEGIKSCKKEIYSTLSQKCVLIKKKSILTMNEVSLWRFI